jgi:hypothetical protein
MQRIRIGTGFHLSLAVGGLLIAAAITSVGLGQWQISETVARNKTLDHVVTEGLQLVQLTNEVLLYSEERAARQWRGQFDQVEESIRQAKSQDESGEGHLRKVATQLADMRPLFDRLVTPEGKKLDATSSGEVAGILSAQLFRQAIQLQSSLRGLKTFSDGELKDAYTAGKERTFLTFGLLGGATAL